MTTKTRYYNVTGRDLLVKARSYLAEDNLLQASEKGWGAAAQMVKSIAEARGWPHNGHHELWRVANRLVDETGDRDIRTAFGLAGALHTNFYEGWLPRETVEDYLARVAELISKLEALSS
ncbi:MAG: PaREP1 family protein [bacterium]|nr:PaREP1 family protein [bacterium]MDE0289820.1 PaREP1 family protein [bacterium]